MATTWTASRRGTAINLWRLAQDETLRLDPGKGGIVARAQCGTVVVTQTGDPEDHVLLAGEEMRIPRGGVVVAWALTPSVLAVRDPYAEPARVVEVYVPCP
jgi:Protein of unknown function (DUF2917)